MESLPRSLDKWANLPHLTQRARDEWSAQCPQCGDNGHVGGDKPDRFRMFSEGSPRGWCRSCGFFEFADADDKRLTPQEIDAIKLERTRLANRERERVRTKIETLEENAEWRGYNRAMMEQQRQLWRDAGIDDPLQDYWELGYVENHPYTFAGEKKTSPALTIPYWRQSHVRNIQMRLLSPPTPSDKYRFQPGLPAPVYLPDKDELPKEGTVVVEGAKKAMVTWLNLGHLYSVVGIPSKAISHKQVDALSDCDPVILALDPDANEDGTSLRNARLLGAERCLIATLPAKIDDLFVEYKATPFEIETFLKTARYAT